MSNLFLFFSSSSKYDRVMSPDLLRVNHSYLNKYSHWSFHIQSAFLQASMTNDHMGYKQILTRSHLMGGGILTPHPRWSCMLQNYPQNKIKTLNLCVTMSPPLLANYVFVNLKFNKKYLKINKFMSLICEKIKLHNSKGPENGVKSTTTYVVEFRGGWGQIVDCRFWLYFHCRL